MSTHSHSIVTFMLAFESYNLIELQICN